MISTHENTTGSAGKITLAHIEAITKEFSGRHETLSQIVLTLNNEVEALKNKYLPSLKRAVNAAAAQKVALHTAIQSAPELFVQPRTVTFHGVKVGLQKGKGGIECADAEKTVALIRKIFGEELAPAYIRTQETPDKNMLKEMSVDELKKIGCTVGDTSDQVVIKPTDSDVEKAVAALLKDAVDKEV